MISTPRLGDIPVLLSTYVLFALYDQVSSMIIQIMETDHKEAMY